MEKGGAGKQEELDDRKSSGQKQQGMTSTERAYIAPLIMRVRSGAARILTSM